MHWFATPIQGWQLKGNQVQILNSPAAVSFIKCRRQFTLCHWKFLLPGRRLKQKQVRRPACCHDQSREEDDEETDFSAVIPIHAVSFVGTGYRHAPDCGREGVACDT